MGKKRYYRVDGEEAVYPRLWDIKMHIKLMSKEDMKKYDGAQVIRYDGDEEGVHVRNVKIISRGRGKVEFKTVKNVMEEIKQV